jgi:heme iron utilization protein
MTTPGDKKNGGRPPAGVLRDIRRLLSRERFAVLATCDGRTPHASLIAFAGTDDGASLVFMTPRRSLKYRNIMINPKVSLVIDSRPRSGERIESVSERIPRGGGELLSGCGLTVTGVVRPVRRDEIRRIFEAFFRRHPGFRRYSTDPDYSMFQVRVKTYIHTRSLAAVTRVKPAFLRRAE